MNNKKLALKRTKKAFGIELDIHDYHLISERFEALQEIAPAVSVSHLNFEEVNGFISGTIKIKSFVIDFESEYTDSDILRVYNYLEIDILDQLNAWKKTRFQMMPERNIVA